MENNEILNLYNRVKEKLKLLYSVTEESEKIIKLAQTIDYFQKDKEWLQIIENWLDKINASINTIKKDWNSNLIEMIDSILNSVKK